MKKSFDKKNYNQINIVESLIFAFKKTFCDTIYSKLITSAKAEVYCRAIESFLFLLVIRNNSGFLVKFENYKIIILN
ncbi:MAG: hypothetical protein QXE31_03980 [Candidatus Woesearchaeota archaeon]